MSTTARQNKAVAVERVTYDQLTSGTAFRIFSKLPNGAVPIAGYVGIITPFNSASADALTVGKAVSGTAASANAYLTSTSIQQAAGTRAALSALPVVVNDTDGGFTLTATWTGTGAAPDEGELIFVLELAYDDREHFSEG